MPGSSGFGAAPGPVSPLDYVGRRGELKSTPAGLVVWDGKDWVPSSFGLDPRTLITLPNGLTVAGGLTADTLNVTGGLVLPAATTFWSTAQAQPIATGVDTPLHFERQDVNPLGMFGTDDTRMVCPAGQGGSYLFITTMRFSNGAVGTGTTERALWHRVTRTSTDGHTARYSTVNAWTPENRPQDLTVVSLIQLSPTDSVQTMGFQGSGANLGFALNLGGSRMSVARMPN